MANNEIRSAEDPTKDEEMPDEEDTVFRNTYTTQILPDWETVNNVAKRKAGVRSRHDYTIVLNKHNAERFGDVSRVGWKGRVDYSLREMEEEAKRDEMAKDDFYRDPNRLLEVTLSTIILMASDLEVPEENYLATELYLRSIKNEFGNHPPNVSGMLKLINHMKKKNGIDYGKQFRSEPDPKLIVTKIPSGKRSSRIPTPTKLCTDQEEPTASEACANLQKEFDSGSKSPPPASPKPSPRPSATP